MKRQAAGEGLADELAGWVASVRYEDLPSSAIERLKVQACGMVGAAFAGLHSQGAQALLRALRRPYERSGRENGSAGFATVVATGERFRTADALFANTGLSMAFDYDDYLFMGHTGHSAVFSPLAVCEALGKSGKDFLLAAAIANEIEGRIGAAVLLGPYNGQLWSFIHAVGTACAAGRLLGLNREQIRNAIGLSLYLPPYPMVPGFMGPSSKLLTAAVPSTIGLRAAELAAEGMTGAPDILESRHGFLNAFSYLPMPAVISGLGKSWVTDSICFKAYPGCAYVSSIAEALRAALAELGLKGRGLERTGDLESLEIRATLLTLGMDALSAPYRKSPPTSVNVNFSAALSAAVVLLHGDLRPRLLEADRLTNDGQALEDLTSRIRVRHDWDMTVALQKGIAQGINLVPFLSGVSFRRLLALRGRVRDQIGGAFSLRGLRPAHARELVRTARSGVRSRGLDRARFDRLEMRFTSEVRLALKGGRSASARVDLPPGSAGRPWEETVAQVSAKVRDEAPERLGKARVEELLRSLMHLDRVGNVRDLTLGLAST
ncbi:MAG: MmgE/PrpD family protein [Nitrospirae bacterium]|nr:MmgE/PrpD family protein [Nitrospirota bacterium]